MKSLIKGYGREKRLGYTRLYKHRHYVTIHYIPWIQVSQNDCRIRNTSYKYKTICTVLLTFHIRKQCNKDHIPAAEKAMEKKTCLH
jgi:hypothetical protein